MALQNPGNSALGSGSELVLTASTTTSVNKFSLYDFNATSLSLLSFSTVLTGNSGQFTIYTGNGANFATGSTVSNAETLTALRFTLGGSTESPTVATTYSSNGTFTNAGLTSTGVATGSVLQFAIYGNNSGASTTYSVGGTEYTISSNTFDIFLNGSLIGNDLATGALADGSIVDSFAFQGQSSAGNVGALSVDDITYGSFTPVPEPSTYAAGLLAFVAIGYTQRRRTRGLVAGCA